MTYDKFETYATLRLNLENYAWAIESHCAEMILPAPKGVYCKGILEPVLADGQAYHISGIDDNDCLVQVPVTDITYIKPQPIYKMQGRDEKVVISAKVMQHRERYLSSEPTLPYRGLKILKTMFESHLTEFVKYARHPSDSLSVYDHLVSETILPVTEAERQVKIINRVFQELLEELERFTKNFVWNLYTVTLDGVYIKVEMGIDQRAYLYLMQQDQEKLEKEHRE